MDGAWVAEILTIYSYHFVVFFTFCKVETHLLTHGGHTDYISDESQGIYGR